MPKKDFAKELKEEFAKGNLKPSQLKRSKSTETLTVPKSEIPLTKSKSSDNIFTPHPPSLPEQIKQLKQELVFSQTTAQNYLTNLQQTTAQLDNTKLEIKELKEDFAEQIKQLKAEKEQLAHENNQLIDKNNELRLQALKDFDQHRENQQGIEQAVEKLVNTEQTQINYQVQNGILLREKVDLEKQLKNAQERIQKLYQLKGLPHTHHESR